MPSSADDLLLWIIVQYNLHSLDLLVMRKGSIVYHVVNSVLSVSLYNPGLYRRVLGIRCNLGELLTLLISCLSDLFPSVHCIQSSDIEC